MGECTLHLKHFWRDYKRQPPFFEVALVALISASFTGAERCLILAFAKPANGATILEDDATIHTAKFEQRKEGAISNRRTQLGTSACIAVAVRVLADDLVGGIASLYASASEEGG